MWTETTREDYRRDDLTYASGTRDAEWAELVLLLPPPRRLGRRRKWELREIVDALLYIGWSGCPWRALPADFPPHSTVQRYFYAWRDDGTWARINAVLVARGRELLGRRATPTAGIIDSQSVPTTESGGPRGIDAGKRIKGRKRHIVTDTNGLLLAVRVHEASIQDPHGAVPLLHDLRHRFPQLHHIFADRVYAGRSCKPPWPIAAPGPSRSSNGQPASKASSCCPGAGLSSAALPGSAATAAWPKISRPPSPAPPPGSSSPTFDYLSDALPEPNPPSQIKQTQSETFRVRLSGRGRGRWLAPQQR
jgi:putative transposase